MHTATIAFDPRDSALHLRDQRDAVFARLRLSDALPVDTRGEIPLYSLVHHADVARAYAEPAVFSPCAGLTLDAFDPARRSSPSPMLEMALPDRHRALRGAMHDAFRASELRTLMHGTREMVDRFIMRAQASEEIEFVEAFAQPAASMMMSHLLAIAPAESDRLDRLLRAVADFRFETSAQSMLKRETTELSLLRELTRIVRSHRRREQRLGLVGLLLKAKIDGESLTDHDIALNCLNVALAGTGAIQHALAGAAAVWSLYPDALDRVALEPGLSRPLIEETLRWLTPVVHLTRIVTMDVEIRGQRIPSGAGVCLWNVSANRDETVFEEPATFRPGRTPNRHLSFGRGPQHCLGAQLARMQLDALLRGMLKRGARFAPCGAPVWIRSSAIAGPEHLPLCVHPGS